MTTSSSCDLCGGAAQRQLDPNALHLYWFECNDCGSYAITSLARTRLAAAPQEAAGRLNLISFTCSTGNPTGPVAVLWKARGEKLGIPNPPDYVRDVEDFLEEPIQHSIKPDKVLLALASKLTSKRPFDPVELSLREVRTLKIAGWPELAEWLAVLADAGWVDATPIKAWRGTLEPVGDDDPMPAVSLTPRGWTRAEGLAGTIGSRSCFIAMSFGIPERSSVQGAIESACKANGFEARTVDQQEFTGPIADRIIADLKKARFVVADFTEHKHGVYFEAGFAEGRGIPVIYTVRQDEVGKLHFDTRHLNHIVWNTPAELEIRLSARIGAIITR